MKQRYAALACSGVCATMLLFSPLLVAVPTAYSETYIGGLIGTSVSGNSLTEAELTDTIPSSTMSDRELSRSIVLGGKAGYYFPQAPWFGVETEVFYTTPNIKQENVRITIPPGAIFPGVGPVVGGTTEATFTGDHLRVVTWAPVNVMFRYHKARLQPYVGVGLGLFFAQVHTTQVGFEGSQGSFSIGLNTKAGLEFYITRDLSVFGEWKYNRTRFGFDANNRNGAAAFDADYHVHFVAMGLNFHF